MENGEEKIRHGKRWSALERGKISSKQGMMRSIFSFSVREIRVSMNPDSSKRGLGMVKCLVIALEKRAA